MTCMHESLLPDGTRRAFSQRPLSHFPTLNQGLVGDTIVKVHFFMGREGKGKGGRAKISNPSLTHSLSATALGFLLKTLFCYHFGGKYPLKVLTLSRAFIAYCDRSLTRPTRREGQKFRGSYPRCSYESEVDSVLGSTGNS